jgi:transcriptional regulator with GAF, ATPase, and Fis domain
MNLNDSNPSPATVTFEIEDLERRSWRIWILLAGICLMAVAGLAFAVYPLVKYNTFIGWPWDGTHSALLFGMSVLMLAFVAYLTHQQRALSAVRRKLSGVALKAQEDSERHCSRLLALVEISQTINAQVGLGEIFDAITSVCAKSFKADRASLMLLDGSANELVVRSLSGQPPSKAILNHRQSAGTGIAGWVATNRRPLVLGDGNEASRYPELHLDDASITSSMVVPIILRDELVGVLSVTTFNAKICYDDQDLQTLQAFAEHAGGCIRHGEHVTWLRSMVEKYREKDGALV